MSDVCGGPFGEIPRGPLDTEFFVLIRHDDVGCPEVCLEFLPRGPLDIKLFGMTWRV